MLEIRILHIPSIPILLGESWDKAIKKLAVTFFKALRECIFYLIVFFL